MSLCRNSFHDAVDQNAVILTDVLARLATVEGRIDTTEAVVTKVALDAEANDVQLNVQLRAELNAVTSRIGDELRAENVKVQESLPGFRRWCKWLLLRRFHREFPSLRSPSSKGALTPLPPRLRR